MTFEELAASRRQWIEAVLRPWCRQATRGQLLQAEREWHNLAGRVDSDATLWTWAWERFPALVHDDLPGVNETHSVVVTLGNGQTISGFPDGRRSIRGNLLLVGASDRTPGEHSPIAIDDIAIVHRV